MNYLRVDVFGNVSYPCDASNNGISVTHKDKLVVPCADGNLSEEDVARAGYVIVELHQVVTAEGLFFHFRQRGVRQQPMRGGTYIWTSDSRFSRAYGRHPIPLHDRFE